MPLAFFKRDVLASPKSTDGGGAGGTFFGIQVTEAVEAVGKVITGGEALTRQLLLTASTQETVLVPWLVMIGHTSSGDWLLALNTLHGKLLFVTGHAVVIVVFRDEALGANWLLAALAAEAGFMPAVSFMFHLPGARHDGLLACMAFRRILVRITLGAQQLLIFGGERLVHQ